MADNKEWHVIDLERLDKKIKSMSIEDYVATKLTQEIGDQVVDTVLQSDPFKDLLRRLCDQISKKIR